MKMMDKNYQVLNNIVGLDELMKDLKEDKLSHWGVYPSYKDSFKGLYFKSGSNKRNFCSCGYISSTTDTNGHPYCPNCDNELFVELFKQDKEVIFIDTEIEEKDNMEENRYVFKNKKWTYEVSEDNKTVFLKSKIDLTRVYDKNTDLNTVPAISSYFEERIFDTIIEETKIFQEMEKILPPKFFYSTDLKLTIIANIIQNPDYLYRWDTRIGKKILESFSNKRLYYYWNSSDIKKEILDILKFSPEKILKKNNIDYNSEGFKLYLKDNIQFDNINNVNEKLKIYEKNKDYDFLLKLFHEEINVDESIVYIDYIINNNIMEEFKTYYNHRKYLNIGKVISSFYFELQNIESYDILNTNSDSTPDIKDKCNLLLNHKYDFLKNISNLEKQGFPKEKILLFEYYIESDPMKAYSFLNNKRKLTKKQIKEEKEVLKKIL